MNLHLCKILSVLLIGGAFTSAGCAKGTYLEINFTGTLPPLSAIALNLTLNGPDGGVQKPKECPNPGYCTILPRTRGDVIRLPTSSALKLDGEVGTLIIEAAALGVPPVMNLPAPLVGMAPAQSTVIRPDQTWSIDIAFVPATGP